MRGNPFTSLTKDDPPCLLIYNSAVDTPITSQGVGIHHPRFGQALKKKMDALGIECEVRTGRRADEGVFEFVKRHFGMK